MFKGKMLKMKSERSSEVERDIIDEDNVPANATSTYDPSSSRRIRKRPKLLAEYHAQKIDPVNFLYFYIHISVTLENAIG